MARYHVNIDWQQLHNTTSLGRTSHDYYSSIYLKNACVISDDPYQLTLESLDGWTKIAKHCGED